jgi:hypothetical protein
MKLKFVLLSILLSGILFGADAPEGKAPASSPATVPSADQLIPVTGDNLTSVSNANRDRNSALQAYQAASAIAQAVQETARVKTCLSAGITESECGPLTENGNSIAVKKLLIKAEAKDPKKAEVKK